MLMTAAEFRTYVQTEEPDPVLEARLSALELLIRGYTNNLFQQRGFRVQASVRDGRFCSGSPVPFVPGDTVMVSESENMQGQLFTVKEIEPFAFTVQETA